MGIIDQFMPVSRIREIDRIAVQASPAEAWKATRAVDLYRVRFIHWLFALRTAPDRLAARLRGEPPSVLRRSGIDEIVAPGTGFFLLGEEPGREAVIGSVGRFWKLDIDFAQVTPDEFTAFSPPDFGKLAWNIRVDPREGGGSWISVEVRVTTTDPESWLRFRRYWLLIGRFSRLIRRATLRMLRRQLGTAQSEHRKRLAGDELLSSARFQRTHARTIEAPPSQVWPWLVQLGCQRAGWYSIDRLDNAGIPSANRIIPELQHLSVGDILPARPKGQEGFAVLRIEPERALVLGAPSLLPGGAPPGQGWGAPWQTTWAFVLEPIGDSACRLVVRVRADYAPGPKMALALPVMSAIHELMQRAQLRNLGRRVVTAGA